MIAELILGKPLFPGESSVDQLVEIIKILGYLFILIHLMYNQYNIVYVF